MRITEEQIDQHWQQLIWDAEDYGGAEGVTQIISKSLLSQDYKDKLLLMALEARKAGAGGEKMARARDKKGRFVEAGEELVREIIEGLFNPPPSDIHKVGFYHGRGGDRDGTKIATDSRS